MISDKLFYGVKRKIWTLLFNEKSWAHHNLTNLRDRELFGLISRPHYMYGMLRAADLAKYCGKKGVTVIEFGVANGAGLCNMIELAPLIERETGVQFRIVGFDTGEGLPAVEGYKDHPEIWVPGDFANEDKNSFLEKISGRAEMIWGDVANTISPFMDTVDYESPIGFVAIDVDIYSATVHALRSLVQRSEKYTLAVSLYFDDVNFYFANEWCGELGAVSEFNAQHQLRKIGLDRSLPGKRPFRSENWYSQMFVCHILDHDLRQRARERNEFNIAEHHRFLLRSHLS